MSTSQVSPPDWLGSFRKCCPSATVLLCAGLLLVGSEFVWLSVRAVFDGNQFAFSDNFLVARDSLIAFFALAYGIYRVLWFHPIVYSDYLGWLKVTPWKKGMPLPLGPVSLCLWDAIIVLGLTLLLLDGREVTLQRLSRSAFSDPMAAFLMGYGVALTLAVWLSDQRVVAYAASALQAFAILPFQQHWPPLAFLAASVVVANFGLTISWKEFPWTQALDARRTRKRRLQSMSVKAGQLIEEQESPDKIPASELGWPFAVCSPAEPTKKLGKAELCLMALLFGVWCWCMTQWGVQSRQGRPQSGEAQIFYFLGIMYTVAALVLSRLCIAFALHHSPISLFGRLATGRLCVPGFDRILLGPIGVILVPSAMLSIGHWWLKMPIEWLGPLTVVATLWAHILCGPDLDEWKLTAPARVAAGNLNKRAYDQLT